MPKPGRRDPTMDDIYTTMNRDIYVCPKYDVCIGRKKIQEFNNPGVRDIVSRSFDTSFCKDVDYDVESCEFYPISPEESKEDAGNLSVDEIMKQSEEEMKESLDHAADPKSFGLLG